MAKPEYNEIMNIIHTRRDLKSGRTHAKLQSANVNNVDVAAALGVDPNQVSRWRHGHVTPNRTHTLALAALLDQLSGAAA
jgi:hypothetical protein